MSFQPSETKELEDKEYYSVDLQADPEEQCGHLNERWGRNCSRLAGHYSDHRDGEVSWPL